MTERPAGKGSIVASDSRLMYERDGVRIDLLFMAEALIQHAERGDTLRFNLAGSAIEVTVNPDPDSSEIGA